MNNFTEKYEEFKKIAENALFKKLSLLGCDDTLKSAMAYSVKAGGKRVRPVLLLMTADALGADPSVALEFACALEFIHTYSLIHDDLPSMDNDDYRRGQPTNHKVYGEAIAVLAGDALLNLAAETVIAAIKDLNSLNAAKILFFLSGNNGMINGQVLDIKSENSGDKSEKTLYKIHDGKTAGLIVASVLIPSLLAGKKFYNELKRYGESLGLLFQITDDLLDETSDAATLGKTTGKDKKENKLTFVTLYGTDKAREKELEAYKEAVRAIERIDGCELLGEFADFIYGREK